MRYTLENGKPVEVKAIVLGDMRIVYPTDAQVDAAGAGYPLQLTDPPEYASETETLEQTYSLENDIIVQEWTIIEKPQPSEKERRIEEINNLINESNAEFEAFKETPIIYPGNGLRYKPSYVKDYWVPALVLGEAAFPMYISDADCIAREFTLSEFQTLYAWLLNESATEIARVNAYQQPLIEELRELEDEDD